MSEQTSQEPTMEEILASIRRIISEDEAPAEDAGPQVAAEPEPPPALNGEAEASQLPEADSPVAATGRSYETPEEDEDGDLELTQKVETHGDLDFVESPPETEPEPEPQPQPQAISAPPVADASIEALVSAHTAQVAASHFGQLSANILMPHSDRTLEDVVCALLRPLLQQWLDENLPGIVQQAVTAEVERIARSRVR